MKIRNRTLAVLASMALAALAAPIASATTVQPPKLSPLDPGALWSKGELYQATMYAKAGATAYITSGAISVSSGQAIETIAIDSYACPTKSKTLMPSKRTGAAKCSPITAQVIPNGGKVTVGVPASLVGEYLSVEQVVTTRTGTNLTPIAKWVEAPIYPSNPIAAGPANVLSGVFAGAAVTFAQRPWSTPQYTTPKSHTSQAWLCPDYRPNTNDSPLSTLGCTMVFSATDDQRVGETFILNGKVKGNPSVDHELYFVSFYTVNSRGALPTITYEVRSKASRVRTVPKPKPRYTVDGMTISAGFKPAAVVPYRMVITKIGGKKQYVEICDVVGNAVNCSQDVEPGAWRVNIYAFGKNAVGLKATKKIVIQAPAPDPTPTPAT